MLPHICTLQECITLPFNAVLRALNCVSPHSLHHSVVILLLTMSAQIGLRSCPKKWSGHFPGDPRYSRTTLSATAEDLSCLGQDVFLSTAVLDCIIQRTAVLPELSQDLVPPMIGSFGYEEFMLSSNLTASFPREKFSISAAWKVHNEKVLKLRTSLAGILHHQPNSSSSVRQRLITPIVKARHFFVACFNFSVRDPIFLLKFPFTTHWNVLKSAFKDPVL